MGKTNLIESVFKKNNNFEIGIFCSFGLNLNFLENYLMKLDGLKGCDDICIFTDANTYDSFIYESYTPRWLNTKYLVNRIKTNGVFHPKLYMLASEKKIVISIGSANLTRDGIASNLELLSFFEVSESKKQYISLLRDCIDYVQALAERTKSQSAISQVKKFTEICRSYLQMNIDNEDVQFIHNLDQPIADTIVDRLKDQIVSKVQIISPFYDAALAPLKIFKDAFSSSAFEIYIQQNKSTFPKDIFNPLQTEYSLYLYENIERYMHGKAIVIHTEKEIFLFMGSANFTRSALLQTAEKSNYEIGVFGNIEMVKADNLIMPNNKKAMLVKNVSNVQVAPQSESQSQLKSIEYIAEAILENDRIQLTINDDTFLEVFTPKHIRLMDFDDNTYEETIQLDMSIELTSEIKKKVPGKKAIQILGHDKNGELLKSNIVWIVELEESNKNLSNRRLRRIYNDPFELSEVLQEILKNGDEHELQMFLLQFNISLDLTFPPRTKKQSKGVMSKGNIDGLIPMHTRSIFKENIQEAYRDCLNRLLDNLKAHVVTPQLGKINNYMMIQSSLYSLVWTIGDTVYHDYKESEAVDTITWGNIRSYFDMLFMYIEHSLNTLLEDGAYRDKITKKIQNDDSFAVLNLDQYLLQEYNENLKEIIYDAKKTLEYFENIYNGLKVEIEGGYEVEAMIFKNNLHLQPSVISKIHSMITQLENILDKDK